MKLQKVLTQKDNTYHPGKKVTGAKIYAGNTSPNAHHVIFLYDGDPIATNWVADIEVAPLSKAHVSNKSFRNLTAVITSDKVSVAVYHD